MCAHAGGGTRSRKIHERDRTLAQFLFNKQNKKIRSCEERAPLQIKVTSVDHAMFRHVFEFNDFE